MDAKARNVSYAPNFTFHCRLCILPAEIPASPKSCNFETDKRTELSKRKPPANTPKNTRKPTTATRAQNTRSIPSAFPFRCFVDVIGLGAALRCGSAKRLRPLLLLLRVLRLHEMGMIYDWTICMCFPRPACASGA